jgi:hypothetical protein
MEEGTVGLSVYLGLWPLMLLEVGLKALEVKLFTIATLA